MRLAKILAAFCIGFCLAACGGGQTGPAGRTARQFPEFRIPPMLEGEDAMEYFAAHFWDAFLDTSGRWLCDSAHIAGVDSVEVEKQVGTYATVLGMMDFRSASSGTSVLYDKIEACQRADTLSNVFSGLVPLLSRYLYDPNSPVRNEDAYRPFVAKLAKSEIVPPVRRSGYAYDARMCSLNATGTPAADFVFTDVRGRRLRLYDIQAPLTLLFFSNPGCPACREIMDMLTSSEVSALVDGGTLAIVNMYIDEELDKWREYQKEYPSSWHTGYDADLIIRSDLLYNVRAIPSLYLLDADKRVLLKDATPDRVLSALPLQ